MLQVVSEAGPEQFGLNFHQTAYMKLPEPQLAFDPRVAKLHHSSAAAIVLLRFLTGHLFSEGNHRRIFHPSRHSAAMALIFRTALRLVGARLTVAEFCFVKIGD